MVSQDTVLTSALQSGSVDADKFCPLNEVPYDGFDDQCTSKQVKRHGFLSVSTQTSAIKLAMVGT